MLQQTTVVTVIPYFQRFLEHFPTIADLAAAPDDQVLNLWAGLGYYARARNLIACARVLGARGGFPTTLDGLRSLPGIGAYTAAAIGAIAFSLPVVPIDGNVERVTARLFAIETPLPAAKPAIAAAAAQLGAQKSARAYPGDFAQGLFDLGAMLCTPRNPSCLICPWQRDCAAHQNGIADLPRKPKKTARPVRFGTVFLLRNPQGQIGLRRRPPSGLLGGMFELPGSLWCEQAPPETEPPASAAWRDAGIITHVFTHFELRLTVRAALVPHLPNTLTAAAPDSPLPTVMKKAVTAGLAALLSATG